jgi:hypothetical protein
LAGLIKPADETLDAGLKRLDTNGAVRRQTGGSRVKNRAEKVAAVRGRREGWQAMVAELLWVEIAQASQCYVSAKPCAR